MTIRIGFLVLEFGYKANIFICRHIVFLIQMSTLFNFA